MTFRIYSNNKYISIIRINSKYKMSNIKYNV